MHDVASWALSNKSIFSVSFILPRKDYQEFILKDYNDSAKLNITSNTIDINVFLTLLGLSGILKVTGRCLAFRIQNFQCKCCN